VRRKIAIATLIGALAAFGAYWAANPGESPVESAARSGPRGHALVVARALSQSDPRPAPCGPDGSCGDSMFLGLFDRARTVAGVAVPERFKARIRFHTPLIAPTEMALVVEWGPNASLTVLRRAGFNERTKTACFIEPDEQPVDWHPVAPGITKRGDSFCYEKQ
jgi:hypothetical protein